MEIIKPNWPAPSNIHAFTTTRLGGVSHAPYDSLNVANHVGDDPLFVARNRHILIQQQALPAAPQWLTQIHSTHVAELKEGNPLTTAEQYADACYTQAAKHICAVMTADCLPLVICNQQGTEIAAIHAGWRGLCAGIIEQTLTYFRTSAESIMVWLGPAIGPTQFEVGNDVREHFIRHNKKAQHAFVLQNNQKYLADIYHLVRQRLWAKGITQIYGGDYCTVSDKHRFFSYRRDNITGRMATLIWRED